MRECAATNCSACSTRARDISGAALLRHTHLLKLDDHRLFQPVLKRIKRISSINKAGSFVGSESVTEDITNHALGRYGYKWFKHAILERLSIPPTYASVFCWARMHISYSH